MTNLIDQKQQRRGSIFLQSLPVMPGFKAETDLRSGYSRRYLIIVMKMLRIGDGAPTGRFTEKLDSAE